MASSLCSHEIGTTHSLSLSRSWSFANSPAYRVSCSFSLASPLQTRLPILSSPLLLFPTSPFFLFPWSTVPFSNAECAHYLCTTGQHVGEVYACAFFPRKLSTFFFPLCSVLWIGCKTVWAFAIESSRACQPSARRVCFFYFSDRTNLRHRSRNTDTLLRRHRSSLSSIGNWNWLVLWIFV